jgi:hypothetical protein
MTGRQAGTGRRHLDRRRAGSALLAYGIAGLIVLACFGVATAVAATRLEGVLKTFATERDRLVVLLDDTSSALDTAGLAIDSAGSSMADTGSALGDAGTLALTVSAGARNLVDITNLSILGQQPFAGFADSLNAVAGDTDRLATSLSTSAASVAGSATDLSALGSRLRAIRDEIGLIRGDLSSMDLGSGDWLPVAALGVVALLVWLAIPAVAAIWLGVRWRRTPIAIAGSQHK